MAMPLSPSHDEQPGAPAGPTRPAAAAAPSGSHSPPRRTKSIERSVQAFLAAPNGDSHDGVMDDVLQEQEAKQEEGVPAGRADSRLDHSLGNCLMLSTPQCSMLGLRVLICNRLLFRVFCA